MRVTNGNLVVNHEDGWPLRATQSENYLGLNMNMLKKSLLTIALAASLVACSTNSRVSKEGTSNSPVWPKLAKEDLTNRGTFPNKDSLKLIQKTMTRDQVYHLIGVPHFSEGFQVHEWDYLFHFNTAQGIESCQMKVLFDKNKTVQSIFWKAVGLGNSVCPALEDKVIVPVSQPERINLSADALFPFNKGNSSDLLPAGQHKLDQIAAALAAGYAKIDRIHLVGHTDRLGADAYNYNLGLQRAEAVKQYLQSRGVDASITVASAGKSQPVSQNCVGKNSPALKSCLQPDRRVSVDIFGMKK